MCRLAGVQLDRKQTQAAADARTVSARMQRVELADELLAVARGELARLNRPHTEYWGVGGQDPTVLSVVMPEPPPRGRRDLISGAMALVDRHMKLVALDAGRGDNSIVDRWLSAMLGEVKGRAVSDRGMVTAVALMAAELRGDHDGVGVIVAGCEHLDEAVVALVAFAAEAARMAGHRSVPDELLAEVASRHLLRLARGGS